MHSTRHLLFALGSAAVLGATLGACFTGSQAEGLPCTADSHCGPTLECIAGYCGGVIVCGDGSTIEASLACNGIDECEGGHDEDPEICGTNQFFCDDESTVPLAATCDDIADCPDGEDEVAAICVYDECMQPRDLFEFFPGPEAEGIDNALGLFPGQLIGDNGTDLVFAQREGSFVRVLEFEPGMPPTVTELPGDVGASSPNFLSPIQDVYPYDFENDGDTDLLVVTSDTKFYGYISEPPAAPVQLVVGDGSTSYFEIPGSPQIVDVALGKVNDGAFVDIVALTEQGVLWTALGDPSTPEGENPFDLALDLTLLVGTSFTQILLADLSGDGLDELLVIGVADMPQLWILERDGDSWGTPSEQSVPIAPTEFAVGDFNAGPGLDIALIERMQGRVMILGQVSPGMFMPSGMMPFELGTDINGLAVRDIDCDGTDDLVFNVESPPAIQVLFGNDMAELSTTRSLTIESAGRPQGNVALLKFDPDGSWDLFHAVSETNQLDGAELRSFVSVDPSGDLP